LPKINCLQYCAYITFANNSFAQKNDCLQLDCLHALKVKPPFWYFPERWPGVKFDVCILNKRHWFVRAVAIFKHTSIASLQSHSSTVVCWRIKNFIFLKRVVSIYSYAWRWVCVRVHECGLAIWSSVIRDYSNELSFSLIITYNNLVFYSIEGLSLKKFLFLDLDLKMMEKCCLCISYFFISYKI